ncbi:hypothetical protein [Streptomyces massasporeus]|uniref:hypothetical protein n=1 Tax=Streptomyces massasporeus TaxID=67324 RepID=UPI0033E0F369
MHTLLAQNARSTSRSPLVIHSRSNPFFPLGNGEAIAREIPETRPDTDARTASGTPPSCSGTARSSLL